ncbi:hypothetical protein BC833DRAFT_576741 [Globomyces pollinis-pini]|nr:hypothetical protein BC833DRAFT_576741 [Globomyces pollinis-pini]
MIRQIKTKSYNDRGSLTHQKSSVTWNTGLTRSQRMSLEQETIIDKCFATFLSFDNNLIDAVVVATFNYLRFYFDNGEHTLISLPFRVRRIYPLQTGLLLESASSNILNQPILYTLFHPTDIPLPVSLYPSQSLLDYKFGTLRHIHIAPDKHFYATSNDKTLYVFESNCNYDDSALETSINFNEDTDCEAMKSTLQFRLVGSISLSSDPKENIFFVNDQMYGHIVCFLQENAHDKSNLVGYLLNDMESIGNLNGMQALIPVQLSVYVCKFILCSLFSLQSTIRKRQTSQKLLNSHPLVLDIQDIDCTKTITIESEYETYTGSLGYSPHSAILPSVLSALSYAIPPNSYKLFYSELMICLHKETNHNFHHQEWNCFIITLLSFFNISTIANVVSKSNGADFWSVLKNDMLFNEIQSELPPSIMLCAKNNELSLIHRLIDSSMDRNPQKLEDLGDHIADIILAFQLLYEEFLINTSTNGEANLLGSLLLVLTQLIGSSISVNYIQDGFSNCSLNYKLIVQSSQLEFLEKTFPNRFFNWIQQSFHSRSSKSPLEFAQYFGKKNVTLFHAAPQLKRVCYLLDVLLTSGAVEFVKEMVSLGNLAPRLDDLPLSVSFAFRDALHECRNSPKSLENNPAACFLIGRYDLAYLTDKSADFTMHDQLRSTLLSSTERLVHSVISERADVIKFRFRKDDRIEQAFELLVPVADTFLSTREVSDLSTDDVSQIQQAALAIWMDRNFSLGVGRGMIEFESAVIVPTETFPVPKILRSARLPPLNAMVEYIVPTASTIMDWPEFHMGVATALRIRSDCPDLDSAWIVFNQKSNAQEERAIDCAHAGFLFGLGLTGHLTKLEVSDSLSNYWNPNNQMLAMAHLLGLATAYIGTKKRKINSLLSVNIPALIPTNIVEFASGYILRTGAIVGYGLLNFSSSSQFQFDKVLKELLRQVKTDSVTEQSGIECYLIGCGFSLGFIGIASATEDSKIGKKLILRLLPILAKTRSKVSIMSASIALGLTCLRTGNQLAAKALEPPANAYLLDWISPELLLVQTICRHLILWDDIEPTPEWIEKQIPHMILKVAKLEFKDINRFNEHLFHCYYAMIAGLCFVLGLRYAGSNHVQCSKTITLFMDKIIKTSSFKYASFGYMQKLFHGWIKSCLYIVFNSICILKAGSGDLKVFKVLKPYQLQSNKDLSYGLHMSINMSLGMLFLGSGTCTLDTSNRSIAMLFCSFFPIFPSSTEDNRCHLQALRHLWALAVSRRCLVCKDAETGEVVKVPAQITLKNDYVYQAFAPLILPEYEEIKNVTILGPRYWEITISTDILKSADVLSPNRVWVQRKTPYLPYSEDPDNHRGILSVSFPKTTMLGVVDKERLLKVRERFIQCFSSNPQIISFVKYMCNLELDDQLSTDTSTFNTSVLYDCLSQDKPNILPLYISIYHKMAQFSSQKYLNTNELMDIKNLITYFRHTQYLNAQSNREILLNASFMDVTESKIKMIFRKMLDQSDVETETINKTLTYYCQNGRLPDGLDLVQWRQANAYLSYNMWPSSTQMSQLIDWLSMNLHTGKALPLLMKKNFRNIDMNTILTMLDLLNKMEEI